MRSNDPHPHNAAFGGTGAFATASAEGFVISSALQLQQCPPDQAHPVRHVTKFNRRSRSAATGPAVGCPPDACAAPCGAEAGSWTQLFSWLSCPLKYPVQSVDEQQKTRHRIDACQLSKGPRLRVFNLASRRKRHGSKIRHRSHDMVQPNPNRCLIHVPGCSTCSRPEKDINAIVRTKPGAGP